MDQLPAFMFYVAAIFGGFAFLALLADLETKRREREARRNDRARRRAQAWREMCAAYGSEPEPFNWGDPCDGTRHWR